MFETEIKDGADRKRVDEVTKSTCRGEDFHVTKLNENHKDRRHDENPLETGCAERERERGKEGEM